MFSLCGCRFLPGTNSTDAPERGPTDRPTGVLVDVIVVDVALREGMKLCIRILFVVVLQGWYRANRDDGRKLFFGIYCRAESYRKVSVSTRKKVPETSLTQTEKFL